MVLKMPAIALSCPLADDRVQTESDSLSVTASRGLVEILFQFVRGVGLYLIST